jgi:hypothetical protein
VGDVRGLKKLVYPQENVARIPQKIMQISNLTLSLHSQLQVARDEFKVRQERAA